MGRMVKCRYCGVKIPIEDAYLVEDLTEDLKLLRRYYCNEKHYDYKMNRDIMMERIYNNLYEIIGVKVRANVYFGKMFKEIKDNYRIDVIDKYLEDNKFKLEAILHERYYATLNAEIKYLMTIVQKELHEYSIMQKERSRMETFEVEETIDDFIDFSKCTNKKEIKTFEDVLEGLFEDE